jgi:hypothetical protein
MSDDTYNWEKDNRLWERVLNIDVVATIYVCGVGDDGSPEITCGFLDMDDKLCLPNAPVTPKYHAAEVAIQLFREYMGVDLNTIDIVPYGFFDPIHPPLHDKLNRNIILSYATRIHPGTPVHHDLRFMNYEEINIARERIERGHYEAYRAGFSG